MIEKCTSTGCTEPVTHMESLATGVPKPWCCKHYTSLVELKRAIIERQNQANVDLLELQVKFMREMLRNHGMAET